MVFVYGLYNGLYFPFMVFIIISLIFLQRGSPTSSSRAAIAMHDEMHVGCRLWEGIFLSRFDSERFFDYDCRDDIKKLLDVLTFGNALIYKSSLLFITGKFKNWQLTWNCSSSNVHMRLSPLSPWLWPNPATARFVVRALHGLRMMGTTKYEKCGRKRLVKWDGLPFQIFTTSFTFPYHSSRSAKWIQTTSLRV